MNTVCLMTLYHEQRQLCIIMGKFQELNFLILRLRMILSCNDTNMRKPLHFWVEICIKPSNIEAILYGQND